MMKKIVGLAISAVLVLLVAAAVLLGTEDLNKNQGSEDDGSTVSETEDEDSTESVAANESENGENVTIVLGTVVTVNGSAITADASSAVYASTSSLGYSIVNIASAGVYTISGSADDTQVRIIAGSGDEVVLVLNGTSITCDAAPAILVQSAFDPEEGNASGVTVLLADGTTNTINGSHSDDNDGALSSNVSLLIDGDGALDITADMEGIETTMHLTINGGSITIRSDEDAINANEDGVSIITINDGIVYADSSAGTDGDGIDSNGYIIINGGAVYGFASGENSGIDSDMGTIINGGTVLATGRMNDGVSSSSGQASISLSFSGTLTKDTLVYVLDPSGDPVVAFKTLNSITTFVYSSPDLESGTYQVYAGGSVTGTFDAYGMCSSFSVTSAGTLQASGPGRL
jgi:hypothetical protein